VLVRDLRDPRGGNLDQLSALTLLDHDAVKDVLVLVAQQGLRGTDL